MVRLFVGVPAPRDIPLEPVLSSLRHDRNAKLVDASLYHVTLAFIGETPDARVGDVAAAVREGAKGVVRHAGTMHGIGAFPTPHRARVLWLGIEGTRMGQLAHDVRSGLLVRKVPFDGKPFQGHVTISRFREPADVADLVERHKDDALGAFPVERVNLYQSKLGSSGPTYEVVEAAPLEESA